MYQVMTFIGFIILMSRSKASRASKLSVDKDPFQKQQPKTISLKSKLSINSQNLVICRVGTFDEHYMITGKIGQGSFGTVYKIKHKTLHFERALKIIKKRVNQTLKTSSFEEIEVLKKLDHANILKIYEFYDTAENYYIVTQIFPGQELFDFILEEQKLSEQDAAQILKEVLRALVYTHSLKIAHRDLKPQNILIRKTQNTYKIKIIDWGLGTLMGDIKSNRICGTPEYCAPEVLKGCYSLNCDMWSVGAIAYVMMTGEMPFTGKNTEDTIQVVKKGYLNTNLASFRALSTQAQQFIVSLMTKNQGKRLKALQAIEHPWIVKNTKRQAKPVFLKQTLQRLRDFNVGNKLGVAVLSLINNHMSEEKERQKLQQIFKHLDKNNDGVLSIEELIEGYSDLYGKQVGTKIAEDTFNKLDINHNGNLEFSEFVTFGLKQQKRQHQERLREAFSLFDRDKNGKISKQQIEMVLKGKVSVQMESQVGQIIQQIDKNGDNQIDVDQFMKCIQNLLNDSNRSEDVNTSLKTSLVTKVEKVVEAKRISVRNNQKSEIMTRQRTKSLIEVKSNSRTKK